MVVLVLHWVAFLLQEVTGGGPWFGRVPNLGVRDKWWSSPTVMTERSKFWQVAVHFSSGWRRRRCGSQLQAASRYHS